MNKLMLPEHLKNNKAFKRVFQQGKLTIGLIAPFKGYPDSHSPDMSDFAEMAKMADEGGVSALWVRDVPFYDPTFGDVGQIYDPFVTIGYLAGITKNITIGTAGIITPLRNPVHVAKSAASLDKLTNGRFILGMSSGDRLTEYPAINEDFQSRGERFRESWDIIRKLTEESFPTGNTKHYGRFSGNLDLVPKPSSSLPMMAIGRCRQDLEWIANTSDAWIWHGVNPKQTSDIICEINRLGNGETWHPFGYANFVELTEDPNEPSRLYNNIYLRGGANSLVEYWKEQEEKGLAHVTVNLKPTRRPAKEVMQEFIETIIPNFHISIDDK